jgi:hypothetical protein
MLVSPAVTVLGKFGLTEMPTPARAGSAVHTETASSAPLRRNATDNRADRRAMEDKMSPSCWVSPDSEGYSESNRHS